MMLVELGSLAKLLGLIQTFLFYMLYFYILTFFYWLKHTYIFNLFIGCHDWLHMIVMKFNLHSLHLILDFIVYIFLVLTC